ncbi:hypothetical protein CAPTEDRAFT_212111 [Capitella teleta]|nr:hypothetical protein CAPTEDRAFT_212111 [Capitella teleta]|eukprot:ELT94268.1 hypothetical protein CAPTEDRAFT_212111 [Capitella teleta]
MELSATSYKLKLTLIGFEEEVVQEKDIEVKAKSMSLFIQTDKGIYKPGETVKYRAFTVTPDLTPYTGSITVTISDPKKNKIDQLKDLTPVFGVVNSSLELSTEPVLGMWTITVESYVIV